MYIIKINNNLINIILNTRITVLRIIYTLMFKIVSMHTATACACVCVTYYNELCIWFMSRTNVHLTYIICA